MDIKVRSLEDAFKEDYYETKEQEADYKEGIMKKRAIEDDDDWFEDLDEEMELNFGEKE